VGYDPKELRDMHGKWTDGSGPRGSKGNRSLVDRISTQHQRDTAKAVIRGAATGIAEGIVAGTVIGAVTGGAGAITTPALIARGVISGALAGAKLNPVHAVLAAGFGASAGLAAHRERVKNHIAAQHKKG
jgi:hypothetical protein